MRRKPSYESLYSHHLGEAIAIQTFYIEESYKQNISKMPNVVSVTVDDYGAKGKKVFVTLAIKLKNGEVITYKSERHVDFSALPMEPQEIEAYLGLSREEAKQASEDLSDSSDFYRLAPELFRQRALYYALNSFPHTNGGEFLKSDAEEINHVVQNHARTKSRAKKAKGA